MMFKVTANFNGGLVAAKLEQSITRGLQHTGQALMKDATDSLGKRARGKSSQPGTPPNSQSGQLQQSFGVAVNGRTARVAATAPYARIQERGGVIRPKNAKYLWMPINARRMDTPRNVMADKSKIAFIPRRRGGFFVVKKSASGRKTKSGLLYVLLNQVWLPARPYMGPSLRRMSPKLAGIFADAAGKHFMAGVTQ